MTSHLCLIPLPGQNHDSWTIPSPSGYDLLSLELTVFMVLTRPHHWLQAFHLCQSFSSVFMISPWETILDTLFLITSHDIPLPQTYGTSLSIWHVCLYICRENETFLSPSTSFIWWECLVKPSLLATHLWQPPLLPSCHWGHRGSPAGGRLLLPSFIQSQAMFKALGDSSEHVYTDTAFLELPHSSVLMDLNPPPHTHTQFLPSVLFWNASLPLFGANPCAFFSESHPPLHPCRSYKHPLSPGFF